MNRFRPRPLAGVLSLLLLTGFAPGGSAHADPPVASCSRECDPREMNGGAHKAGTEPTLVVLYGHFEDILNMAPLNTQAPDGQHEPDLNQGFLMPVIETNSQLGCSVNACLDFHFRNNEFTLFSSPGLVSYLGDGSWYTHQEPGLSDDAKIVGDEIRLYWYMSAHALPTQNSDQGLGATAKVGAMPGVGVYARMETGRFKFRGDLLAESSDDANPASAASRVNMITTPDGEDVYEFMVPMRVKQGVIPGAETKNGFIVYINPFQYKSRADDERANQVMQADWRVRTGPLFPPRLVVGVEETMKTAAASLSNFDERMFVRWSFLSVWGSYDMRDYALKLESTGRTPLDMRGFDFIGLKRGIDHDAHFKPVNATWAYDFVNHPLADGDYEVTASIPNLQDTYLLEERFRFTVADGRPQVREIGRASAFAAGSGAAGGADRGGDVPGFEAILMLGSAAAAAVLVGRRRG